MRSGLNLSSPRFSPFPHHRSSPAHPVLIVYLSSCFSLLKCANTPSTKAGRPSQELLWLQGLQPVLYGTSTGGSLWSQEVM